MRPSHGHPSQECAATQRESQASEDIGAIAPPVERGWGRLWPLTQNLTHVDLKAEEVRLGRRPTCAVVLDARMLPASVFGSVVTLISGDHCRIYRKEGTTTVDENAIPTFIEDLRCGDMPCCLLISLAVRMAPISTTRSWARASTSS